MRNDSMFPSRFPKCRSRVCLAAVIFLVAPVLASAQTANVQPRIAAAIDERRLTILKGNTHPLARPEFDRGAAPDSLPMQRMLLVLKRGPDQEAALDALMEQQQDASSPNFHKWLTPAQFGQQFGPSDQDIQTITMWLTSHGFQIAKVSNGRTVIEFTGTAGQVQEAFHTAIHKYNVNGEDHWANSSDPQIPVALTPVVAGVNTLHNFPRQPMHQVVGVFSGRQDRDTVKPSGSSIHFRRPVTVAMPGFQLLRARPADFAKMYNVPNRSEPRDPDSDSMARRRRSPWSAKATSRSEDIRNFRNIFGLPGAKRQLKSIVRRPGSWHCSPAMKRKRISTWSGRAASPKGATLIS